MTSKQILYTLIRSMDPYLTFGVPTPCWELVLKLTEEIHGKAGVDLLESAHKVYEDKVDATSICIYHSLSKWEDNTEVDVEEIVKRLRKMGGDDD